MLQSMGLQRVGHDWATELNWPELHLSLLSMLQVHWPLCFPAIQGLSQLWVFWLHFFCLEGCSSSSSLTSSILWFQLKYHHVIQSLSLFLMLDSIYLQALLLWEATKKAYTLHPLAHSQVGCPHHASPNLHVGTLAPSPPQPKQSHMVSLGLSIWIGLDIFCSHIFLGSPNKASLYE